MVASVTTIAGMRTHATSAPLSAPMSAPNRQDAAPASGVGSPIRAKTPVATLQMANCEPTEISICPVRITSTMPSATISTGMLASTRSRSLARVKRHGEDSLLRGLGARQNACDRAPMHHRDAIANAQNLR